MDEHEKCPHQELEDSLFEAIQTSDLSWREEIEPLFNTARTCVAYYVLEEKNLSDRELATYLDYQKKDFSQYLQMIKE